MPKNREPVKSLILYRLLKWSVVSPILHTYFQGRIYGAQNVPLSGPLVVVSNHGSYFDPPILSNCLNRPVAFMAKEELFRIPVLKQGIQLYGAYPVDRASADRSAIRSALSFLENGWATGIFLSGTRTASGRITSPKLGAALIATKAQAPLLPVCLWGTHRIFSTGSSVPRSVPVTVRIGQPIAPPPGKDRSDLAAVTAKCVAAIHALHDLGR
ncbi:MAG: 1-acyl-sn-glycerol-3-phosphate acyltransferase [Hormoscilla sp. GUM202]|nr:1-acyl-sn-glycerol-3-phosphate acyltransferase [Hormoscilla sp. GUM202]